jgi:uncharacterized surface protein with fasciclin (FAS1) repeats
MKPVHSRFITVGVAAVAMFGISACSNDSASTSTDTAQASSTQAAETTSAPSVMADPGADLIGAGCATYAEKVPEGPGSVTGMALDPVTVAASNNPMLKTLTQALSGQLNPNVNLVDTLNGDEFTVFAPTDDAFAKIDAATLEQLKTDSDLLTSILTYHVVPGQAGPSQVTGEHVTVQGAPLTVTGEGDELTVNNAGLVCGAVKTANATVSMIDTVLMPPNS